MQGGGGGRPSLEERVNGFSVTQVAERVGLSVGQLKSRIKRGYLPKPTKIVGGNRMLFTETWINTVLREKKYSQYLDPNIGPQGRKVKSIVDQELVEA
jgi:predicted DNA-binding transcriptional regulator AlpA